MNFDVISEAYGSTILALGAMGGLMLLQLIVVDVTGLRARHAPGTPVDTDPSNFLFRATRTHANTNESIAIFVLLALFSLLVRADADWTNGAAIAFVAARTSHMLCYYAGLGVARSASFAVSLLALGVLFVTGLRAAL